MKALRRALLFVVWILLFNHCDRISPQEAFDDTPVDIPDRAFLYKLISQGVDLNKDSIISYGEAEAVTSLDITSFYGYYVTDPTGIEAFTNLTSLTFRCNVVESLNLCKNTRLTEVIAFDNDLVWIDVSNCHNLKELDLGGEGYCYKNQLTNLDVSHNPHLKTLKCGNNQLTELDLTHNQELEVLECHLNQLSELDVTKNDNLLHLVAWANQLSTLDVSNCESLLELDLRGNLIDSLNLSKNTALMDLDLCRNKLSAICISHNTLLERIFFSEMPSLEFVCTWVSPFPPEGIYYNCQGSPNISYAACCQDHSAIPR